MVAPHLEDGSRSNPDIWHREITRMGIVSCGQRVLTARRGRGPNKKPEGWVSNWIERV